MNRNYLGQAKLADLIAAVPPDGIPVRRLAQAIDSHVNNVRSAVVGLAEELKLFTHQANTPECIRSEVWVFATSERRDAFKAEREQASRERVRKYYRTQAAKRKAERHARGLTRSAPKSPELLAAERAAEAERKALKLAAAELAKRQARLAREAKAAELKRAKVEAQKQRDRLKAETRAAGQLKPQRGTTTPPAAPKTKGPAHLPGAPINHVEPIKLKGAPESRWDTSGAKSVVDSSACRAWARAAA